MVPSRLDDAGILLLETSCSAIQLTARYSRVETAVLRSRSRLNLAGVGAGTLLPEPPISGSAPQHWLRFRIRLDSHRFAMVI